jgi:hypothetical protein
VGKLTPLDKFGFEGGETYEDSGEKENFSNIFCPASGERDTRSDGERRESVERRMRWDNQVGVTIRVLWTRETTWSDVDET